MELVRLSRNKESGRLQAIVQDGPLEVVVDETINGYSFVTNGEPLTSELAARIGRAMDDVKTALAAEMAVGGDSSLTEEPKPVE